MRKEVKKIKLVTGQQATAGATRRTNVAAAENVTARDRSTVDTLDLVLNRWILRRIIRARSVLPGPRFLL